MIRLSDLSTLSGGANACEECLGNSGRGRNLNIKKQLTMTQRELFCFGLLGGSRGSLVGSAWPPSSPCFFLPVVLFHIPTNQIVIATTSCSTP